MSRSAGITNGTLLAGRLLLAGCFLPPAIGRLSNISGFAMSLSIKGMPYADVVATLVVVAEIFGPLALIVGLAPRLSAFSLIVSTAVTTGTLHRFWEYGGLSFNIEQAVFLSQLGILAGLLFYCLTGPGGWSWHGWWKRGAAGSKPAAKKKRPSRPRTPKPRPVPARPAAMDEDDMADAA